MKIKINIAPEEAVKLISQLLTASGTKENADNVADEQSRQAIINNQIALLIEASKHVHWDKLPSVSLALDTLLQNRRDCG